MRTLLVVLVEIYRWGLSPLKVGLFGPGARCRFEPTCSEYAVEALRRHGSVRGLRLVLGRLLRCHPWGGCGCDPVPPVDPGVGGCAGGGGPGGGMGVPLRPGGDLRSRSWGGAPTEGVPGTAP